MYRPEGMKNPYMLGIDGSGQEDILHEGWEAGADAMLEALKGDATVLTGDSVIPASGDYPEIHVPTGMKGWLAYIPDES